MITKTIEATNYIPGTTETEVLDLLVDGEAQEGYIKTGLPASISFRVTITVEKL